MKPELFWISGPWRGKLAIAARPRGGDWLNDEANGWRRAGVDVVVSLLENEEASQLELMGEGHAAEHNSISFISFPIPDRGVPASFGDAASLMIRIAGQLEAGKNVAVHCRQGVGRSGDRGGRAGHFGGEPGGRDGGRQLCSWSGGPRDARTASMDATITLAARSHKELTFERS